MTDPPNTATPPAVESLRRVTDALSGTRRPSQEEMCEKVSDALSDAEHIVVSAPTGTGKSIAYLVPALTKTRPVIVATATKALQDQLLGQDIPKVEAGLGRSVVAVTLKGRSNYLCKQKLDELSDPRQEQLQGLLPADAAAPNEMSRIMKWSKSTETGDKSELTFEPTPPAWASVSVDSTECPGRSECPKGDECFAERAIAAAQKADVVIVNLHLYLLASTDIPILPAHDAVVIDEAHELEHIASSVFGLTVAPGRCNSAASRLRSYFSTDTSVRDECDTFADTAKRAFAALSSYEGTESPVPVPLPEKAQQFLDEAVSLLRSICSKLADDSSDTFSDKGNQYRRRLMNTAASLADDLSTLCAVDDKMAVWVENDGTVNTAPIDVSDLLRTNVFETVTAVMCSATIPPNHSTVWGLEDDSFTYLSVDSPFDYKANSLLYVPKRLPKPGSPNYEAKMHDEMEALIRAAEGRTLGLFSSWRAVNAAVEEMRSRLPYDILSQNDLSKPELMRVFLDNPQTCLFGTLGLWQGVDAPGSSLIQVIIPRLPFPRPTDPLLSARRRLHGDGWFMKVDIPIVATRMAQGSGRLIRTETDRGVVSVLDSRLANARYGKVILDAMQPHKRTIDRADVERFLKDARAD